MNRTVSNNRLLKLADFLETVPAERFDLREWHNGKDCGTVACAVGWATTIPGFRKAGLGLDKSNPSNPRPTYQGRHSWGAVTEFFGAADDEVENLFTWAGYDFDENGYLSRPPTAQDVAKRIREFVEAR